MKKRVTASSLGFIKDSEGVYRRGNFVFRDGKIIRESNIVPSGDIKEIKDNYTTMGECIRSVLAFPASIGEMPRTSDVYIDKVGENYKPSKKFSKNTVAVVTSQRQVIEIKAKDITEQTDDKALENKDKEDKPVNPKEIKSFSKPEDIETKTKKELKESTRFYNTEEPDAYLDLDHLQVSNNPSGKVLDVQTHGLVQNGDTVYVVTSGGPYANDPDTIAVYSVDYQFPYIFKAKKNNYEIK